MMFFAPKRQTPVLSPARLNAVLLFFTVGLLLIGGRLGFIQWVQSERWSDRATQQQERVISMRSTRGSIYDRNGRLLAMSTDTPSIYAIPAQIDHPKQTARALAPLLGLSETSLVKKLKGNSQFRWIKRHVTPQMEEAVRNARLTGIDIQWEQKRFYPKSDSLAQILGMTGIDDNGLEGLERAYHDTLQGSNERWVIEKDATGKPLFPRDFQYRRAPHGDDLHLSIDEVIQHIAERELNSAIKNTRARGGVVIVMDPVTGEILAMAVKSSEAGKGASHARKWQRNRAITDIYEPGSTFKIVSAASALEEGVVSPGELIDCEQGTYKVAGTVIHDHDSIAMGVIPFSEVVAQSSNVGMVKVMQRLKKETFFARIRAFGFGKRRGVDLLGESPGLLRDLPRWSDRSLASIAIGQEIGVTPLQMITGAAVIANGGWLVTPHLVLDPPAPAVKRVAYTWGLSQEKVSSTGSVVKYPKHRVISTKTAETMVGILQEATSDTATGSQARIAGFSVAGKTGTAQKTNPDTGRYYQDRFVSSFIGFAPARSPEIAILVAIDEPEGDGYGGKVAAPVFSAIGSEVLRHLNIVPDLDEYGVPKI